MSKNAAMEPIFNEMQLDALKELGNIGASHASTALTNLIKKDVMIDVPECYVCKVEKLPEAFGDMNQRVVGVYFDTVGEKNGHIIMILPEEMSLVLTDLITGVEHIAGREFTGDDMEMAAEIGNILVSAYLSAISNFADVMLIPSPPSTAVDMMGAIMQLPAQMAAAQYDHVVVIKTIFTYEGDAFPGFMLYIPDPDTQSILMSKFGIE
jgi:chemotaxis protein CheC